MKAADARRFRFEYSWAGDDANVSIECKRPHCHWGYDIGDGEDLADALYAAVTHTEDCP